MLIILKRVTTVKGLAKMDRKLEKTVREYRRRTGLEERQGDKANDGGFLGVVMARAPTSRS